MVETVWREGQVIGEQGNDMGILSGIENFDEEAVEDRRRR